jgi:hypothetical protein
MLDDSGDPYYGADEKTPRSGLLSARTLSDLIDEENMDLETTARQRAAAIELVIIDSLHACMPDASDVSDRDLGEVIARAREIIDYSFCSVLLVHHSNVSDTRERGHGSMKAALDFQFHAKQTAEGLRLKCTKMRNAEDGWEMTMGRRVVDVGPDRDGKPQSTLVLETPHQPDGLDEKDEKILEAVEGGSSTQAEIVTATGLPQPTISRRLRKLVRSGELETDEADGRSTFFLPD